MNNITDTLSSVNLIPNTHEKHNVSNKSLKTLEKVMYKQDDYGFEKYQQPLRHTMNYSWSEMALEELADCIKYLQCEMDRKEMVITILEFALDQEDPSDFIRDALQILKIRGTGK